MAIAKTVKDTMAGSSFIRKMFEMGAQLKKQHGEQNVCDFTLGNPDLEPPAAFQKALADIVNEKIPLKHGYMANAGYAETRKSVADFVSREQGEKTTEKSIIMTCGAGGGLNVVLKTILNPGDTVIVNVPYFVEYNFYIRNHGGEMVLARTRGDFDLDVDAIEKAIDKRTAGVLINSPNNPTGKVYPETTIRELCRMLERKSAETGRAIYLLSDEPYRKIVYDGLSVPPLFANYKNSIVVNSYSKDLSIPGERLGYIAVHPGADDFDNLVDGMILCNRILGFVNAPALMQRVVTGIQGTSVDAGLYKKRRDLLCGGLAKMGYDFITPGGTFYLFPKAPGGNDVEFVKVLQEKLVLVVPGTGFGAPGYFRIVFCVGEETITRSFEGFEYAIKKLKR
ncbi:MAG TPA: pyridoxal phosphate-dependent aminotransferase [Chitinivibrionales bacterium]|nr:pyridoxal phosphate-dependent aminotransferase [Chitinivibrionales bacterium]